MGRKLTMREYERNDSAVRYVDETSRRIRFEEDETVGFEAMKPHPNRMKETLTAV